MAWCKGEPSSYFSRACNGDERIVVVDGMKDLWALWQAVQGTDLQDLVIVSSTHGGGNVPAEWRSAGFWAGWSKVFLGHDNDKPNPRTRTKAGDEHAQKLARLAERDTYRVWPVGCKDWNEFFLRGATVDDFRRLLATASPMNASADQIDAAEDYGYSSGEAADIESGFHNGYLYHVMTVVDRTHSTNDHAFETRRTVAIRSDKTIHHAQRMPAPPGTLEKNRVWRLVPDGSLLAGDLRPKRRSSWSWLSVQQFIRGECKSRPLSDICKAIIGDLKSTVWLPSEDDYVVLACVVITTYVQAAFDAVPSVLITGESGTGKSKLTIAVNRLFANALPAPIAPPSAAALAQLIHETRGAIAVDDAEGLVNGDGSDSNDKLVQLLKVAYKKLTSMKATFCMKDGGATIYNVFGVKLFNNTAGVGPILGSRMIRVRTAKRLENVRLDRTKRLSPTELADLRNELHTWAFLHIDDVVAAYLQRFPDPANRAEEIAAPLQVIAGLTQDSELQLRLERALAFDERAPAENNESLLDSAIKEIIVIGAKQFGLIRQSVSVTEVRMRMELIRERGPGNDLPENAESIDRPEWIGRQVLRKYADASVEQPRVNLFGTYLRGHRLSDKFVEETLTDLRPSLSGDLTPSADVRAFCRSCATCDYATVCPIRKDRISRDGLALV